MTLRFNEDGTFRVLQMADIQDKPEVNRDTIRLIKAAIREAKPDLVVLTGDQIRGYDPAYIDTFLRRRGEKPGARVRLITEVEARIYGVKRRYPEAAELAERMADRLEDSGHTAPAVLTGDEPPSIDELMAESAGKVRRTIQAFLQPVVDAGVPFAVTYGNHDFQCGILPDEQDDMYRELPGCMNPVASSARPTADAVDTADGLSRDGMASQTPDKPGTPSPAESLGFEPGTFALPIESADGSGRIAMAVMMVNSGDYAGKPEENDAEYPAYIANSRGLDLADSDGYGTPSPEAIAWLGGVQHELGARNGDGQPVPAIAFQHIPPQEFYDCLTEVPAWTPNAVEGARTHAGHCYVLNDAVCRPGSRLGEAIGCADENVEQVEAMRQAGGYFALFCGHDHKNAFVGHVHGMDLGYAPTCGFECYGPKSRLRGVRLFEFHESDPAAYETRMLTWDDLIGRYSRNELRVFFEDHCITDAIGLRNELRRPSVFTTLVGLGAAALAGIAAMITRLFKR